MKLIVHELFVSLFQKFKTKQNTFVKAARLHLYKHQHPVGTLQVEIQDSSGRKIASSEAVSIDDIEGEFFHGIVSFQFSSTVSLRKDTEYRIVLVSAGYEFTEDAYVGWCNAYDLKAYNTEYVMLDSKDAPLALEIWSIN